MSRNNELNIRGRTVYGFFLVLIVSALFSGCGFHLRGSNVTESDSKIYFSSGNVDPKVIQLLKIRLESQDRLVSQKSEADLQLNLRSDSWKKQIVSLAADGAAAENVFIYRIDLALTKPDQSQLNKSLTVKQDYAFDSNSLLSSGSEENRIKSMLRKKIVRKLLSQLNR